MARAERGFEAIGAEGLQQIVDGVNFEGFDRVAVVGGDENDGGVLADQFEDFEAVELGHLNIEEHQIGFLLGDGLNGFEAVGAFGDEFDFRMAAMNSRRPGAPAPRRPR